MEIKITGKAGLPRTDPFKVPKVLKVKYPEAHWRFVGLTNRQIRNRLDEGYIFVPAKEVGDYQGKVGRMAKDIGVPEDVFMVGDTVLMVLHKKDAEAKRKAKEDMINAQTQGIKLKFLEGVKDIDGSIGVIGEGITKTKPEETA